MGMGDWSIETSIDITDITTPNLNQFNLMVSFDRYDQLWMGFTSDGSLRIERTTDGTFAQTSATLPLTLRIDKSGTQYDFWYKTLVDGQWTGWMRLGAPVDESEPVMNVGLVERVLESNPGDAVFDVDYFKLERRGPLPPTPNVETTIDEFNNPTLSSAWEWYTPIQGPTYSLSEMPGEFRMILPPDGAYDHWLDEDRSPQLRRYDLAPGDWAIETRMTGINADADAFGYAALTVGFDQYDQLWLGLDTDNVLRVIHNGEFDYFYGMRSIPIYLRIEKVGDEYTFKYRYNPNEAWTVVAEKNYPGTPSYLGFITRGIWTGRSPLSIDWSYFKWEQQYFGPTRTPTHTPTNTPTDIPTATPTNTPTQTLIPTSTPTFTPNPFNGSNLFDWYINYPVGEGYTSGMGDFNSDGLLDVAVVTDQLLIFFQDQDGTLASPVSYPSGGGDYSLSVGDLNHDGRTDIVVTNFGTDTISLFLQQTNGTMAARITYPTDKGPDAVAVGDITGDGLDDIAVSHWNAAYIGIFVQNVNGTLNSMVTYAAPQAGWDDIAIGDVNGDGRNDVVKMNGQGIENPNLSVFLQNPDGTLANAVAYDLECNCNSNGIGIGDVTGDGREDIIISYGGNRPTSFIAVYAQAENGTLLPPVSYSAYDIPSPVEIADVDLDGRQDVLVLNDGWNTLSVYLQSNNGYLETYNRYNVPFSSPHNPQALSIGDINDDGYPDVAVGDFSSGLDILYHAKPPTPTPLPVDTATPTFTPTATTTMTPIPTSMTTSTPIDCYSPTSTPAYPPIYPTYPITNPRCGETLTYDQVYQITWDVVPGMSYGHLVIWSRCKGCTNGDWDWIWYDPQTFENVGWYDWQVLVSDPENNEFMISMEGIGEDESSIVGYMISDPFYITYGGVPTVPNPTNTPEFTLVPTRTFSVTPTPSITYAPSITPTPSATRTPTATPILHLTVSSTADNGAGSLRQAIADIASGGIIDFDPNLAGQTITLDSTLSTTKNLTIDGSGLNPRVEISGNSAVVIFVLGSSSGNVTLRSLVLKNGFNSSWNGAAVSSNGGQITVENTSFIGNNALNGGAVYLAMNNATLNITQCEFISNTARASGGAILRAIRQSDLEGQ